MSAESELMKILEAESSSVIPLCQELVKRPSEDPPGDTRNIANFIHEFFRKNGIESEIVAPHPEKPNVVATVRGERQGPHVVFNGHMDTFPMGEQVKWRHDPFGGELTDGRLYGRGAADMKGGLSSCIYSIVILNKIKKHLPGQVSITCVSDEEVFGPWGTRYLLENKPAIHGDALINGEPSSLKNIRIGEKGQYWFRFHCHADGGHGAYSALKPSAVRTLLNLLESLSDLPTELCAVPQSIRQIMDDARECYDSLLCKGATDAALSASMNVGTIKGGLSVNMVPEYCVAEVDFRLPPGVPSLRLRDWIAKNVQAYPSCSFEEYDTQDAYLTDVGDPLVQIACSSAEEVTGEKVFTTFSLGGTEARMWRKLGVPAITYGPNHHNMGSADEYIIAVELIDVLKVHCLTAFRFMRAGTL